MVWRRTAGRIGSAVDSRARRCNLRARFRGSPQRPGSSGPSSWRLFSGRGDAGDVAVVGAQPHLLAIGDLAADVECDLFSRLDARRQLADAAFIPSDRHIAKLDGAIAADDRDPRSADAENEGCRRHLRYALGMESKGSLDEQAWHQRAVGIGKVYLDTERPRIHVNGIGRPCDRPVE